MTDIHKSHASYYPGAKPLALKLLFSMDGRILDAQAVGADGVDKRIDEDKLESDAGRGTQAAGVALGPVVEQVE